MFRSASEGSARSRRPTTATVLVPALIVASAASASSQAVGGSASSPSATGPAAEFEAICRAATESDDPFVGTAEYEETRAQLESLPAAEEGSLPTAILRMQVAYQATLQGDHDLALAQLAKVRSLLEERAPGSRNLRDVLQLMATNHLLLGEEQNCRELSTGLETAAAGAACILPIDSVNAHRSADAASSARRLYQELIELDDDAARSQWIWLLNVAAALASELDAVPSALRQADGVASERPVERLWPNLGPSLGGRADLSGGAVMDDFDGDGRLDLVSSSWHPCEPLKALRAREDGGFDDVTAAWKLDGQLGGLNLRQADYDGDGRLDLLILRGAWNGERGRVRNSLLRNETTSGGRTVFRDVTTQVGLASPALPTQVGAWGDYDGDGDLDLYLANEGAGMAIDPDATELGGAWPPGFRAQLMRNDEGRHFVDVATEAGVLNERFAKGASWGDADNDGDLDLFVSNLGIDRLYIQLDGGRFVDRAAFAGVQRAERTFASWWFDVDNDGDLDLFVGSYGARTDDVASAALGRPASGGLRPLLYLNRTIEGKGLRDRPMFEEMGEAFGLTRPVLAMGSNYGDLDADGWPDIYLGTGSPALDAQMPNLAYRNRGGESFESVGERLGLAHLQKGHGVAFGDLDGDGDEDLFHQLGGAYPYDAYQNGLFVNPTYSLGDPPSGHRGTLVLRLIGQRANRFGVGSRIAARVASGDGFRTIHALVGAGSSFGGNSLQVELGVDGAPLVEELQVRWAGSGTFDRLMAVELPGVYELVEGSGKLRRLESSTRQLSGVRRPHVHGVP